MNTSMPAPAALAPGATAALLPVGPSALPGGAAAPLFARALLQIVRGGAAVDAAPADIAVAARPAGVPTPALADTAAAPPTDEPDPAQPLPDLLLSGLLLQPPPALPLPALPAALLPTTPAAASPRPASAAAGAAVPSASALLAAEAMAPVALAPAAPAAPTAATTRPAQGARAALPPLPALALAAEPAQALPGDATPVTATLPGTDAGHRTASPAGQPTAATPPGPDPLMQALGERIALHLQRGSERVVIRLDPPLQGHIEISIRHDAAGTTQVQLSGSSGELVRQLQAISDGLRQELVQRQAGEVSVQVGHAMREQDGRQRQDGRPAAPQTAPGRALDDAQDDPSARRFALSDADGR